MEEQTEKQKLWKVYSILMVIMLGGATLILGGQAVWNTIQQNIAKSNKPSNIPTQTSTPVPGVNIPSLQPSLANGFTQKDAINLINQWLEAKSKIFAPPFDRQLAARLTTGTIYNDIVKPGGSIDWLQQNNAYYQYGSHSVQETGYFSVSGNIAEIEVSIKQEVYFYINRILDKSTADSSIYRFILKQENGTWKMSERQLKN
jgi:hypothetical protein